MNYINMMESLNLITHIDAPEDWGLFFQDNATFLIEGLEELYNNVTSYLVIILYLVCLPILIILCFVAIVGSIVAALIVLYKVLIVYAYLNAFFFGVLALIAISILSYCSVFLITLRREYLIAYLLNIILWSILLKLDTTGLTIIYSILILVCNIFQEKFFVLDDSHSTWWYICCFAETTINLFNTSDGFRISVGIICLSFPLVIQLILAASSVINDQILMNICSDKLFMNIDQLLNPAPAGAEPGAGFGAGPGAGSGGDEVANLPPRPVATHQYLHMKRMVSKVHIQDLSDRANQIGFFSIRDIEMRTRACTVDFYQPVPNLDDVVKMGLLKELHNYFPYGDGFAGTSSPHTLDDPYRIQAYIAKRLEDWRLTPGTALWSDLQRPWNLSPYYDSNRSGEYAPWAREVAHHLERHKQLHGSASTPKLDQLSEIFLASFRNARNELSPTFYRSDTTIRALRSLE